MANSFKMNYFMILTIVILCSYLISSGTGSGNAGEITMSMDKLIYRICTVARDKIHIHGATSESKQEAINSMAEKLKKTSEKLGIESKANIITIIEGVTKLSNKENYEKICNNPNVTPDIKRRFFNEMKKTFIESEISTRNQTNTDTILRTANTNKKEENIQNNSNKITTNTIEGVDLHKPADINSIVEKMETIMMRTLNDNMTITEKLDKAKKLKQQLVHAFRRAFKKSEKLNNYLAVVEHGMNTAVEKLVNNSSRRSKDESTLIGEEALAEGANPKQTKTHEQTNGHPKNPDPVKFVPSADIDWTSTTHFPGITKPYGCRDILKDTCVNLKMLDKFPCDYDGTKLEMLQICDGNVDCPDGSDEKNCVQQVIGKIHNATHVMAKVEMSQNCFKSIIDKTLLVQQGEILAELLNTQVEFLNRYTQQRSHHSPSTHKPGGKDSKRKTYSPHSINSLAYEVAVVVRSFASTLTTTLCYIDDQIKSGINDIIGEDLDKEVLQLEIEARTAWLPSSCKCKDQYCANMTTCHQRCKRYCYQMYSLQNFNCKTNKKGQNVVPLDLVCDGKIDCFDESDESSCTDDSNSTATKFKGRKIFDELIDAIKSNSLSKLFAPVHTEMAELSACIHGLQRRSEQPLATELLKLARDKCFLKLANILETVLEDSELPKDQHEAIYDFLLMANQNLILAMKHTNMGNKKLTSEEDCICHESKCVQVKCPERCVRLCAVKTLFTNYNCSSSSGNASIPIQGICDGKHNCPNSEDELSCKNDICRIHHIKVLRRNIKTLFDRNQGSGSVEIVLEDWRTRVESKLTVLEQRKRMTSEIFKHAVTEMLNDLANAYASMNPTRRQDTDKMRLKKFAKLSQYIMEMLKECTK